MPARAPWGLVPRPRQGAGHGAERGIAEWQPFGVAVAQVGLTAEVGGALPVRPGYDTAAATLSPARATMSAAETREIQTTGMSFSRL
jgi:hypothetical protein